MDRLVHDQILDLDALVIGAGFGGIYTLHKLRHELGLNAVAIDKAGGVGGTWYWNKYPGALSDSEGFRLPVLVRPRALPADPVEDQVRDRARDPRVPQQRRDRYDLRRDIHLETGMTAAELDEISAPGPSAPIGKSLPGALPCHRSGSALGDEHSRPARQRHFEGPWCNRRLARGTGHDRQACGCHR